jgi:hypothetical protein
MSNDAGDFPNRAPAVLAVTVIFIVCSTVFVALRLVSRGAIVRKVGLDDYFIVLAWVSNACFIFLGLSCSWPGCHRLGWPPY